MGAEGHATGAPRNWWNEPDDGESGTGWRRGPDGTGPAPGGRRGPHVGGPGPNWRRVGPDGGDAGGAGRPGAPFWGPRRPPWGSAPLGEGTGPRWPGADRGPRPHLFANLCALRRSREGRMAGGVAAALAQRLRVDPGVVRVLLVVSVLASGIGVALYMLAWLLIPLEGAERNIASRAASDRRGIATLIALSPILIVTLIASSLLGDHYVTTLDTALLLSAAGLFLVYRNAEADEQAWLRQMAESYLHLTSSRSRSKGALAARVLAGVALWAAGMVVLTVGHTSAAALRPLAGVLLLVVALGLLFGPWWLRLGRDLMTERQARIRAEERADMATRVHDSVLQTLALIQRNADDPQRVAQLARVQERELRSWLFEGRDPGAPGASDPTTVAAGAEQIAREVEAAHGVAVEVVTVGDCELDDELRALLAAGREATVNAAKWSGAPTVSLFSEVEPASVSLFVRDRGVGFDPATVAADRRGVAESIRGRMARHGGEAAIRSAPGEGTEVELRMPRPAGRL